MGGGVYGFGRGQGDGRRWGGTLGLAGDRVMVEGGGGLWVWQGTG